METTHNSVKVSISSCISLSISSCISTLFTILIKPLKQEAYDSRVSGDCDTRFILLRAYAFLTFHVMPYLFSHGEGNT